MKPAPDAFSRLIKALCILPNVGPKTAQRMAYTLLQQNRAGAQELAQALDCALKQVNNCTSCNTFCEGELCHICADEKRDPRRLMIVHMPADVAGMEAARCHDGLYFVLMGRLSPLDGIGPSQIGLQKLLERATDGTVREVILATNFTAEGEATAHVIGQALRAQGLTVTRLARGVPAGSELEYVDLGTIAHALADRR